MQLLLTTESGQLSDKHGDAVLEIVFRLVVLVVSIDDYLMLDQKA